MEFRYMVTYGRVKEQYRTYEAVEEAFEKYTKAAEKHGVKVLFWGLPFGVSESLICVCEGNMEDYTALLSSTEAEVLEPWTDGRTNLVMIP